MNVYLTDETGKTVRTIRCNGTDEELKKIEEKVKDIDLYLCIECYKGEPEQPKPDFYWTPTGANATPHYYNTLEI